MDGNNFDDLTRKLATGASRRKVLRGLLGGAAALGGLKATNTLAAKASKTTICHATSSDSNPWVMITVNDNSLLPAHWSHGDFKMAENGCCRNQDCHCNDQCHTGVCTLTPGAPGGTGTGICSCESVSNGTSCNADNSQCTVGDTCQDGACQAGPAVVCTALDQCHDAGTCDPATGICSNPPKINGSPCSDGDACTVGDSCQDGSCVPGQAVVCTASDQCHDAGTCNPDTGVCSNPVKPDGTACDDGNACTQLDTCQAGVCTGSNPIVCTALDQCHDAGSCDPATGVCSNPAKQDGSACDDGNLCTQTDTCQAGVCTGTNPVVCTASDQCHVAGTCDPTTGQCSNPTAPDGTPCNDGMDCTSGDACSGGICSGTVACNNPPSVCYASTGTCDANGDCEYAFLGEGTSCGDCLVCSASGTCDAPDPDCGKACASAADCNKNGHDNKCCCAVKGQPEGTCVANNGCNDQGASEHVCLA